MFLGRHFARPQHAGMYAAGFSSSLHFNAVGPYQVFDRHAKRLQKDTASQLEDGNRSRTVDYLRDEIAERMLERFLDIKRKFQTVLDLGSGPGHLTRLLDRDKVQKSIMLDSSAATLNRDADSDFEVDVQKICGDEENLLKFVEPGSLDGVISCLSLHWVNDLPGILVQIKEALKPDGLFLGAMFGGDTLFELRTSLQLAELEREGGISPHVSPMTSQISELQKKHHVTMFTGTRDVSNLLGRAGFTMLTVDIDEIKVEYPSMWELVEDLQHMGEGNVVIGRRNIIHRDTLAAASAIYRELHGKENGTTPATFQVIYMIGWKPSPTQPQPLERGAGQVNLKDIL